MEPHEADRAAMEQLAAPIPAHLIKHRPGPGNQQFPYIEASTVTAALDSAVGPESWDVAFEVYANCMRCRLRVTLPSGRVVSRDGIGGYPTSEGPRGLSEEDKPKACATDSFKRAALQFGIGADLDSAPEPARRGAWGNTAHRPEPDDIPHAADDVRQIPELRRMSGPALYAWSKEHNLVKTVNDIGKQLDLPTRMVDWSEEEVTDVYRRLCQRAIPEPTR